MRRVVLWLASTVTTVVLLFGYHTSTEGVAATATTQEPIGGSLAGTTTSTTISSASGTGAESTPATTEAGSADAQTVTGDVVQTRWGPVQVELTTSGGEITSVQVLQYPSGNGRDVEINNRALPILVDETLSAQTAEIDMVSGATVTSVGYLDSLQSALDQAGL